MTKTIKPFAPMLACDWHEQEVKFPCIVQPKVDGVHALNRNGVLLGRSLKKHDNFYTTDEFSQAEYHGFCGEMYLGNNPAADDLCRLSSGALRRIQGEPEINWCLFDYITDEVAHLGYRERMSVLLDIVSNLPEELAANIRIIKSKVVNNMEELLEAEQLYLDLGYEGLIIRDPEAKYKYGRCGKTHMGAWRVKRFIEEEIICTSIEEGTSNHNEKTKNELGRSERSSHQENLVPNGKVGTIIGTLLKDVLDPQTKKLLIAKGTEVNVSPGKMTDEERKWYFENQKEIVGEIVKFKLFPKGIKDQPRFANFVTIKNKNDV